MTSAAGTSSTIRLITAQPGRQIRHCARIPCSEPTAMAGSPGGAEGWLQVMEPSRLSRAAAGFRIRCRAWVIRCDAARAAPSSRRPVISAVSGHRAGEIRPGPGRAAGLRPPMRLGSRRSEDSCVAGGGSVPAGRRRSHRGWLVHAHLAARKPSLASVDPLPAGRVLSTPRSAPTPARRKPGYERVAGPGAALVAGEDPGVGQDLELVGDRRLSQAWRLGSRSQMHAWPPPWCAATIETRQSRAGSAKAFRMCARPAAGAGSRLCLKVIGYG